MVKRPLILGFRLHVAPNVGDIGENEVDRGNSQLLVVFGFSHIDSRVDFAFPNQPHFWEGGGRKTIQQLLL